MMPQYVSRASNRSLMKRTAPGRQLLIECTLRTVGNFTQLVRMLAASQLIAIGPWHPAGGLPGIAPTLPPQKPKNQSPNCMSGYRSLQHLICPCAFSLSREPQARAPANDPPWRQRKQCSTRRYGKLLADPITDHTVAKQDCLVTTTPRTGFRCCSVTWSI
jgi:hypothetical protein